MAIHKETLINLIRKQNPNYEDIKSCIANNIAKETRLDVSSSNLGNEHLQILSNIVRDFPQITSLDASDNQITSLDEFNVKNLHEFDASRNQITSLDGFANKIKNSFLVNFRCISNVGEKIRDYLEENRKTGLKIANAIYSDKEPKEKKNPIKQEIQNPHLSQLLEDLKYQRDKVALIKMRGVKINATPPQQLHSIIQEIMLSVSTDAVAEGHLDILCELKKKSNINSDEYYVEQIKHDPRNKDIFEGSNDDKHFYVWKKTNSSGKEVDQNRIKMYADLYNLIKEIDKDIKFDDIKPNFDEKTNQRSIIPQEVSSLIGQMIQGQDNNQR